jgi:hypothetical protein
MRARQLDRFKARTGAAVFQAPHGCRRRPEGQDGGDERHREQTWLEALLDRLPKGGLGVLDRPELQRCLEVWL